MNYDLIQGILATFFILYIIPALINLLHYIKKFRKSGIYAENKHTRGYNTILDLRIYLSDNDYTTFSFLSFLNFVNALYIIFQKIVRTLFRIIDNIRI